MADSLNIFLVAVLALEVGLILFYLNKKSKFRKFVEAMTLLVMIMTPIAPIFPVLVDYQISVYYFPPVYLAGVIGWLFATQRYVIGKENWKEESETKKAIRKTWLLLISGFFVGTIILISITPHMSNWTT